jgi:hypothetical protein
MRFGYTERQAAFLSIVAAHGGYFLRRHFLHYIGRGHGAVTVEFLRAVLTRGHVIASRLRSSAQVYHLTAKGVYAALGEPDSRNRRRHELSAIRRRLMGLDFILARRDWRFLVSEREAVSFFTAQQALPADLLPATQYVAQDGSGRRTTRYFAERFPIGLAPDGAALTLAYVDDVDITEAGFEGFLRRYAPLCRRLDSAVEIAFVTATHGQEPLAEHAFARVMHRRDMRASELDDATEPELLAYVRSRQAWEQGALVGLRQQQLDAIRERLRRFQHSTTDALYRAWLTSGDDALRRIADERRPAARAPHVRLVVHRVPFDYRPFGAWKGEGC